jgi:hypothetical protein
MRRRYVLIALGIAALAGAVACQLNRTPIGSPQNQAQWKVEPSYFCPGDPVHVSWDLTRMPRSLTNCRPANGGLDTLRSCSASSECASDGGPGSCVDGFCCRSDIFAATPLECPLATGCYPDFNVDITSSSDTLGALVTDETRQTTGTRAVTPTNTTSFTFSGFYSPPLITFEDTKTATLVTSDPATRAPVTFPFVCSGTPGYVRRDFNEHPLASEHTIITNVRNSGSHTIVLYTVGPDRAALTLSPGEATDAFNGRATGIWIASLSPRDPAYLVPPRCGATDASNPWPDLSIALTLQCSAD